jgi:predicted phage tail protein
MEAEQVLRKRLLFGTTGFTLFFFIVSIIVLFFKAKDAFFIAQFLFFLGLSTLLINILVIMGKAEPKNKQIKDSKNEQYTDNNKKDNTENQGAPIKR